MATGNDASVAQPLQYYVEPAANWRPVVRLAVWAGIAFGGIKAIGGAGAVMSFALSTSGISRIDTIAHVISQAITAGAGMVLLIAGIGCIVYRQRYHRLFPWAAVVLFGALVMRFAIESIFIIGMNWPSYRQAFQGSLGTAAWLVYWNIAPSLASLVLPALLWALMRRPEACASVHNP